MIGKVDALAGFGLAVNPTHRKSAKQLCQQNDHMAGQCHALILLAYEFLARCQRWQPPSKGIDQPSRFSPAFSFWCSVTGQPGNWLAGLPSVASIKKRNDSSV